MYVKRQYGFFMTLNWSKKPFIIGTVYTLTIALLWYFLDIKYMLPWQPISVIGIAVAFYLGFKNNSSYDRTWEARKIWGGIVNNSRSFGAGVTSFVKGPNDKDIHRELIYRHVAWLTALRYQLRLQKEWEHTKIRIKGLYSPNVCEEYYDKLDDEIKAFLKDDEINLLFKSSNMATQILAKQTRRLQELKDLGYYDDFRHMELYQLIRTFYDDQGKSERIKGFPFPRQYASTALWLTVVFAALLPFALIDVFKHLDTISLIVCPIIGGLVTWIFFLMEKIGDFSENPFEGTYNDVPITNIARTIEIDLREMINDENIPKPTQPVEGFLL